MSEQVCAHCNGRGWCPHATITYEKEESLVHLCCNYCKCGKKRKYSWVFDPVPTDEECKDLEPPVCRACGGKGY